MTLSGALQATISERYGLKPSRDWARSLEQAILELARERRVSPQRIENELRANARLLREVAGRLTIEETFFFRFPAQIEFVVSQLSKLLSKQGGSTVTLWSAGCSSGEEPYSVAIGLQQRLGIVPARANILACDINALAIERARLGSYGKWSFRGVPEDVRRRSFEYLGDETYRIHETLRSSVKFEHLAIEEMAHELGETDVAVVMFRNVGVYFDVTALDRCFKHFHRVLAPEGLLVLAATDPTPPKDLFTRVAGAVGIYQRAQRAELRQTPSASDRSIKSRAPRSVERAPVPTLRPPPRVEALALGNRGELLQALEAANRSVALHSTDPATFLLRGQLLLAAGRERDAIEDFRRVLFLRPDHRLARYWYVVTLHAAELPKRALSQLAELRRQLAQAPDDALLEDGSTSTRELRAALGTFEGLYE